MQAISVQSAQGQYDIHVGDALLQGVGAGIVKKIPKARVALLVVDHAVEQTWAREVAASLEAAGLRVVTHVVVASEDNKSIAQVEKVWRCMLAERVQRSDVLCAMGGGIVGDMAAFAASTYMRGIATVMIPTTLLAMVDAAIGGKSAVNLPMASDAPDASVNSGGAKNSPLDKQCQQQLDKECQQQLVKQLGKKYGWNNLRARMGGQRCSHALHAFHARVSLRSCRVREARAACR